MAISTIKSVKSIKKVNYEGTTNTSGNFQIPTSALPADAVPVGVKSTDRFANVQINGGWAHCTGWTGENLQNITLNLEIYYI